MTIRVVYEMAAQPGKGDEFAAALADLATMIRALPGSGGIDILRQQDNREQFVFIENWPSEQAYAEASQLLPKTAFAPLKPLLGGPPKRAVYEAL